MIHIPYPRPHPLMSHRLTQPARLVLQNLIDGKPADTGLVLSNTGHKPLASVATSLRKRGYIQQCNDGGYSITTQGRQALDNHKRATQ